MLSGEPKFTMSRQPGVTGSQDSTREFIGPLGGGDVQHARDEAAFNQ